jgi:hypothetical protein
MPSPVFVEPFRKLKSCALVGTQFGSFIKRIVGMLPLLDVLGAERDMVVLEVLNVPYLPSPFWVK